MLSRDITNRIVLYELGDLPADEIVELFQELIDSGLAWQLQGHYGRAAKFLIESGLCHLKTKETAFE